MFGGPTQATLWVRYLGNERTTRYPAVTFNIPTDQVSHMVAALVRRGDVAEVWYCIGTEWDPKNNYRRYPET